MSISTFHAGSMRLPSTIWWRPASPGSPWSPFGWQSRFDAPEIRLRTTSARWGETDAGLSEIIAKARARGIRTLIKPHIWLVEEVPGQWRGSIGFDTEAQWQSWADYHAFILHYAELAQSQGAHMLSVGVELHRAVSERPEFWRRLIGDVRQGVRRASDLRRQLGRRDDGCASGTGSITSASTPTSRSRIGRTRVSPSCNAIGGRT